jgi:hypothetical protein
MKKRILVLLSVVALMVVMLAMSVAPGFAAPTKLWQCVDPTGTDSVLVSTKFEKLFLEARGYECTKVKKEKPL